MGRIHHPDGSRPAAERAVDLAAAFADGTGSELEAATLVPGASVTSIGRDDPEPGGPMVSGEEQR